MLVQKLSEITNFSCTPVFENCNLIIKSYLKVPYGIDNQYEKYKL